MIFYGTRSSNLKNGKIKNVTCPNCQKETEMTYSVFGKYAHVYWIPFFPIGRVNVVECNNCKATYDVKDSNEKIQQQFKKEQDFNGSKTPVWFFSGLFVVAGLVAIGMYASDQTEMSEKEYIKDPKVGDVYHINASEGFYSSMKVEKVFKDSVYAFVNEMETDKMTGVDDIDKAENYKEIYGYSKAQLVKLYNDKEIYQIDRN